ncbi:MAG: hypothetical protein R3E60_02475 [Alphaproteobacteria bacterium]
MNFPLMNARNTPDRQEHHRRLRRKNIAMLLILVGLVALFFLITILRMGGTPHA